jgi:hypothetical protein
MQTIAQQWKEGISLQRSNLKFLQREFISIV